MPDVGPHKLRHHTGRTVEETVARPYVYGSHWSILFVAIEVLWRSAMRILQFERSPKPLARAPHTRLRTLSLSTHLLPRLGYRRCNTMAHTLKSL